MIFPENKERLLFVEVQRFRQRWLWILLTGLAVTFIYAVYFKEVQAADGVTPAFIISLIMGFFMLTRLETKVTERAIYYRFPPFIFKWKKIESGQIATANVRTYAPIIEYGGWGLRFGWGSSGSAVNVSGTIGLQIHFKEGRPLLIGTQKPEEFQRAVDEMMQSA